jgi:RNA polymerase subunit RPABC4/transcription elongation factor Spt4
MKEKVARACNKCNNTFFAEGDELTCPVCVAAAAKEEVAKVDPPVQETKSK